MPDETVDDAAPAHYFSQRPGGAGERGVVQVVLAGHELEVVTAAGVFSGDRVDLGTRVLLREAPPPPQTGDLLDLGCGWGPIALALGLLSPAATVWAVDVNERALELTAENARQLYVPAGFAHGFCTLVPDTEVAYKVTDFYAPDCDRGIAWDDPDLDLPWPFGPDDVQLSDKDRRAPRLRDLPAAFD